MPVVFDEIEATVEDEPAPSPGGSDEQGGGGSRPPAEEEFQYQLRRSMQREARLRAD
jgi:hypothetical protein